ncbi:MAG: DUF1295 domain-containing protein [Hyphomicrobiales bacterium]|nr:DUF1295 domain-containing protein [Hyphomicrobiales bacterium]
MNAGLLALFLAAFLSAAMAIACRIALKTKQSGKIDAIWTFATGAALIAAALAPSASAQTARQILVAAIALVWCLRLGTYMWRRAASGPDDPRYAALKREWGAAAPSKLFWFLQAQAACALPLALAAWLAGHATRPPLDARDLFGAAIFAIAIAGESAADAQMAAFRANPENRGRICDKGLWAWSRHPNYFFEWLGWLAYPAVALQVDDWRGWLAFGAPALMYWLLVHVSGVPPLEQELQRSRPDAFNRYKARVNAFWPAPPRSAA